MLFYVVSQPKFQCYFGYGKLFYIIINVSKGIIWVMTLLSIVKKPFRKLKIFILNI